MAAGDEQETRQVGAVVSDSGGVHIWSRLGTWSNWKGLVSKVVQLSVLFGCGWLAAVLIAVPRHRATAEFGNVVAFDGSTVYHAQGCNHGPRMERLTEQEAKRRGMEPCPFCLGAKLAGGK